LLGLHHDQRAVVVKRIAVKFDVDHLQPTCGVANPACRTRSLVDSPDVCRHVENGGSAHVTLTYFPPCRYRMVIAL
jgi:hypothetical protein